MQDRQPRPALPPLWPRLQSWEETRSLIPEKGPLEDDADVVVKGEDPPQAFWVPLSPQTPGDNVFACGSPPPRLVVPRAPRTRASALVAPAPGLVRAHPGLPGPVQQQREGGAALGEPRPHQPVLGDRPGAQAQGDG